VSKRSSRGTRLCREREDSGSSDDNIHLCCSVLATRAISSRHGGDRGGVSHLWVVEVEGKR
jgi:hypothetical protein